MKRILALLIAMAICALIPAAGLAEQSDELKILGDFALTDLNGDEQTQAILENAPLTLVNIWGTFCLPCIHEMPDLGALAEEYKDKVQFIGIVSDAYDYQQGANQEIVDYAVELIDETGANTYTHLIPDENMVVRVLSAIQVVPTTFFLNGQGELIGDVVFGAKSKEDWVKTIDATLALLPAETDAPAAETPAEEAAATPAPAA